MGPTVSRPSSLRDARAAHCDLESCSDRCILRFKELPQGNCSFWRPWSTISYLSGQFAEWLGNGLEMLWQVIVLEELQDTFDRCVARVKLVILHCWIVGGPLTVVKQVSVPSSPGKGSLPPKIQGPGRSLTALKSPCGIVAAHRR